MSQPRNDKGKPNQQPDDSINCIEFTYKQLKAATKDFSDSCKLGEGGFGPVYKGLLLFTTVAIKKLRKVSIVSYVTCPVFLFII